MLTELEIRAESYVTHPDFPHDTFILITVREALAAAKEGNFGVGAALVNQEGKIVQSGHNHVFHPYFRSDLHAEMVVMTEFEKRFRDVRSMKGYTLYSSLEPCPMCLSRLITSGVEKIHYAAIDEEGGMVQRFESMPPEWKYLAERQEFALAQCSPELKDIALQIFLSTAKDNDNRLNNR